LQGLDPELEPEPEQEPEAEPEPEPEPEPEQEAEAREESGGILGFPAASLVFGLSATALALLRKRT